MNSFGPAGMPGGISDNINNSQGGLNNSNMSNISSMSVSPSNVAAAAAFAAGQDMNQLAILLSQLGDKFREAGRRRWFSAEEVNFLLQCRVEWLRFPVSSSPPVSPKDGDIFIYERASFLTNDFKLDGVKYCTKKSTDKIRESHHCIKFNNKSLLGAYARSAVNKNFIRRIYHFMDNISQSKYTLVHYRECKDKDDADNSRLVCLCFFKMYFYANFITLI